MPNGQILVSDRPQIHRSDIALHGKDHTLGQRVGVILSSYLTF